MDRTFNNNIFQARRGENVLLSATQHNGQKRKKDSILTVDSPLFGTEFLLLSGFHEQRNTWPRLKMISNLYILIQTTFHRMCFKADWKNFFFMNVICVSGCGIPSNGFLPSNSKLA